MGTVQPALAHTTHYPTYSSDTYFKLNLEGVLFNLDHVQAEHQPVRDQEDDSPGHARHRAALHQRRPAQVHSHGWGRTRVLSSHADPDSSQHSPAGNCWSVIHDHWGY